MDAPKALWQLTVQPVTKFHHDKISVSTKERVLHIIENQENADKFADVRTLSAVMSSVSLLWRHNGRDGVSNHQPHGG